MIKISDNTGQPNENDKKSSFKEKIIKFFHTKIMGMSPDIYEVIRSLGNRQNDDSSDDIIVIAPDEEMSETNTSEAMNTSAIDGNENQDVNSSRNKTIYDLENYRYPTLDLLNRSTNDDSPKVDIEEQNANKERIMQALRTLGIKCTNIVVMVGANVSLYEIILTSETQMSKVRYLKDDIVLCLNTYGVRVIAPLRRKDTFGIEIPNKELSFVSMESVLKSPNYQESKMDLPCAIGKTYNNEVFMFDLAKAPHLLVSGTPNGVSMGMHAMLTSLLYNKHPEELKIVLIDPKRVELSSYSPLVNHFLAKLPDEDSDPIIYDIITAIRTLNSLCKLMDIRFKQLKDVGASNIKEYNKKVKDINNQSGGGHSIMSYIVVVFDEYLDYAMTAGNEIVLPIAQITQKAHTVGIHLVIAAYKLFERVVIDKISNNIPARMVFRTGSSYDSKLTLGFSGAQQLNHKYGDMLFYNGIKGVYPVRVQCAYIDDAEEERVINYIAKQQGYSAPFMLPDPEFEAWMIKTSQHKVKLMKLLTQCVKEWNPTE